MINSIDFASGRFFTSIAFAYDLWFLRIPTKLPSKEFKNYQLFGISFKLYDEMYIVSFYFLFFKFILGWFRK